jgi:hypothetical protein
MTKTCYLEQAAHVNIDSPGEKFHERIFPNLIANAIYGAPFSMAV